MTWRSNLRSYNFSKLASDRLASSISFILHLSSFAASASIPPEVYPPQAGGQAVAIRVHPWQKSF
jgi:hypothetical protein